MLPPVTFLAVYNYHQAGGGSIDWKVALIVSLLFIIGGFIGSKIALQINQRTLKRIFGFVMLIVAIKLMFTK